MTRTGNRAHEIDVDQFGIKTDDSKRDKYLGFDGDVHAKNMEQKFQIREELRKFRTNENKEKKDNKDDKLSTQNLTS
jgi:hypothetical protein